MSPPRSRIRSSRARTSARRSRRTWPGVGGRPCCGGGAGGVSWVVSGAPGSACAGARRIRRSRRAIGVVSL